MIFGFDRYTTVRDYHLPVPLPNGRVTYEGIERSYNSLSMYNAYGFFFKEHLEFSQHGFKHTTVEELEKTGEYYVYSMLIRTKADLQTLHNQQIIKLSDTVINAVKRGQAKILLCYSMEGDFYYDEDIRMLNKFVDLYSFDKKDVIFLNGNLKKLDDPNANFTIKAFNYFLMNPWFIPYDLLDEKKDSFLRNLAEQRLDYAGNFTKPYKFLSFNRRPRPHRVLLYAELNKEKELAENTMSSLGSSALEFDKAATNLNYYYSTYNQFLDNNYLHNKQSGLDFYRENKNKREFVVDANLGYNLAFNLNESAHQNSFVNVLTETLFEEETIFLSEKIWKPIYCCQPFIVYGNPGTLKELHKLGFQTFSEFWDESYDDETDLTIRLEKIMTVVKDLNKKSPEELLDLTQQMVPILRHNFNNYIQAARSEFFKLKQTLHEQFSKRI